MKGRRRPSRLWLFFWGRQRRGTPWLLIGVLVTVFALALLFAIPGGADLSRYALAVPVTLLVLLIAASLVAVAVAFLRPRGPR